MDNCNNTYCGSLLDKQTKKSFSNWENQQSKLKNKSNTKKNKTKEQKELFKIFTKKITQKEKKKSLEDSRKVCKELYCNIGCKDTLLEPNSLSKKYIKDNKIIIDFMKEERKKIFGKKTNVLDDNFYNKLSKKTSNKLRKKGAISMCAERHFEIK